MHTTNNPGAVAHPTFIKPLQGRQSPRNQYTCWQACLVLPNRGFQQETCNKAIVLSCAHSWWSRQSQYCPVTHSVMQVCHYLIVVLISTFPFGWLLGGITKWTVGYVERRGENPRMPAGPRETERALQFRLRMVACDQ